MIKKEVSRLRPDIQSLMTDLRKLERELSANGSNHPNLDLQWTTLAGKADTLRKRIENTCKEAITQFGNPKGIDRAEPSGDVTAMTLGRPLQFCYGALLCQSGETVARGLSVTETKGGMLGFICSYCFLEVAGYNAVRFSWTGQPLVYSDLMAASHVVACASFTDRRAYYKCPACYYEGRPDVDFSSASALEEHMKQHPPTENHDEDQVPRYKFVKNEPDAAQETKEKISYYVLRPSPKARPVPTHEESVPAREVSPPSSPELATQEINNERPANRLSKQQRSLNREPAIPLTGNTTPRGAMNGMGTPSPPLSDPNINVAAPMSPPPQPPPPRRPVGVGHELPAFKFEPDPTELPVGASRPEPAELPASGWETGAQNSNEFMSIPPFSAVSRQQVDSGHRYPQGQAQLQDPVYPAPVPTYQQQPPDLDGGSWGRSGASGQMTPGTYTPPQTTYHDARDRTPSRGSVQSFQSEHRQVRPSQPTALGYPQASGSQWDAQAQPEQAYQGSQLQPQVVTDNPKPRRGLMERMSRK
jgi:hypothetical protein